MVTPSRLLLVFSAIVALVLLASPGALAADNDSSSSTMHLGVQLGLNVANLNTNPSLDTDPRLGLMVGGNLEFRMGAFFYLQPEVMYAQKGAKNDTQALNVTYRYDYLELVLLTKLKIDIPVIKPFVFAGPDLGVKVNSAADFNSSGQTTSVPTSAEAFDVAFDFGGGVEYWFQPMTALVLSVRYSQGITNITQVSGVSWHTTGVQTLLGLEFGL